MKKDLLQTLKIIIFGAVLCIGASYLFAFTDPPYPAPEGNVPAPINISSTNQSKGGSNTINALLHINGVLSSNSLAVFGPADIVTADIVTAEIGTLTVAGGTLKIDELQGSGDRQICVDASGTVKLCGAAGTYQLSVTKAGAGVGTITGTGISCPGDCAEPFSPNTSITLTANLTSGTFTGWSGSGATSSNCTTNISCNILMSQIQNITATFAPAVVIVVPTLSTNNVSAINQTSAVSGGNISSNGGSLVTVSGLVWNITDNPTTTNKIGMTTDGWAANGSWPSTMTGLTPSQPYYVRSYATNSAGTGYGTPVRTFTTTAIPPTTKTLTVTKTGTGAGVLTATGINCGSDCSEMYATNSSVQITATPSGTSLFYGWDVGGPCGAIGIPVCTVTMNQSKTVSVEFHNTVVVLPTLSTNNVSVINHTSAISGGNISSNGGSLVTVSGLVWNITDNPTTTNKIGMTTDGWAATGSWSSTMTGLTPSTIYYVRSYATNSVGTGYGTPVRTFATSANQVVTVTTGAVSSIGSTTAIGSGTLSGAIGSVTRGISFGNGDDARKITNNGGNGSFTVTLDQLTPNWEYTVYAFTSGPTGWIYGSPVTFTTLPAAPIGPTVSASPVTNIASTTATGHGNVVTNGFNITERGIAWSSVNLAPSIVGANNFHVSAGSGGGDFAGQMTGLTPNTWYWVRSYAVAPGTVSPVGGGNVWYGSFYGGFTSGCAPGSINTGTSPGMGIFSTNLIQGFPNCPVTLKIKLWGAGGGGGGGSGADNDIEQYWYGGGGGGGGGGGYLHTEIPLTAAGSFEYVIGAGGAGGAGGPGGSNPNAGTDGYDGGDSTFKSTSGPSIPLSRAEGGSKGKAAPSGWNNFGLGGAGGGINLGSPSWPFLDSYNGNPGYSGNVSAQYPICDISAWGGAGSAASAGSGAGGESGFHYAGCPTSLMPYGPGQGGFGASQISKGGGGGGGALGNMFNSHSGGGGGSGANGKVEISW